MSADPNELNDKTGLEARYDVRKLKDPTGKHEACAYFVLDPQHDGIARVALQVYANTARANGITQLADDIDQWIREVADGDVQASARNAVQQIRNMMQEGIDEYPSGGFVRDAPDYGKSES